MGMYNAVHGWHHDAAMLLKMLDIDQPNKKWTCGRFRDAWLNVGGTEICIFTRNGGGNRQCWQKEPELACSARPGGEDCNCPGCIITRHLPKHPHYLRDEDDPFDSTYAYIYFSVPDEYLVLARQIAPKVAEPTLKEKTDKAIEEMRTLSPQQLESKYPGLTPLARDLTRLFRDDL